ncbi:hypothetical protein SRS16CHR_00268 [Variovorax sp. SRS16]|uniref:hypothetical protein n=1 Tax=Variovorax sp. SRS16 TaxID=282217 RepID=UPI0013182814|nr:hypothetical protein [Variovorax sp. SRS16]VTU13029.1 hypothetical protein SRS16CHR_00268 [Variovorax sp. SRS16]
MALARELADREKTLSEDPFTQFLDARSPDLRRISRATQGEASLEDVQAEAWLMVADFARKGVAIDLRQREHQQLLISHLFQHLVRYTEVKVRHGIRLDHSPGGAEGEVHPLARLLAADEGSDPLVTLLDLEERRRLDAQADLGPHQSLAGAYLYLLDRLGNRMTALAEHLLISLSYCYQRCAHARTLAVYQQVLPSAAMVSDPAFVPGAWRHFRLERQSVQLSFDFDSDVTLFAEGPLSSAAR